MEEESRMVQYLEKGSQDLSYYIMCDNNVECITCYNNVATIRKFELYSFNVPLLNLSGDDFRKNIRASSQHMMIIRFQIKGDFKSKL